MLLLVNKIPKNMHKMWDNQHQVFLAHPQMAPTTWRWTRTRVFGQGRCSPSTPASWSSWNARLIPTRQTAASGSTRATTTQRSSPREHGWRCSFTGWPSPKTTCAGPSTMWRRNRTRPSLLWWQPTLEQVGRGWETAPGSRAWAGFGNPLW